MRGEAGVQPLRTRDGLTKALLACGAAAGPVFTLAWWAAGATRADYDPLRHPISSLAIGEQGWTQTASFFVTGLLVLAFALGLRRLGGPGGSKWAPRLIGLMGIGLLGAGLFVTDPMNGYPPGTPLLSFDVTLTGRLHRLFSAFVFLGLPGACFVFARLFNRRGKRGWALYSALTGAAFIGLFVATSAGFAQAAGLADSAGLLQRLTLTVGWAWTTLLAAWLLMAQAEWAGTAIS
jgi:hypothetical protein